MQQDLKFALRSITRNPLFSAGAIATLAIGIGLNTSLFGIINVLLFRPLPVERPAELIWISSASTKPDGPRGNLTYPDAVDLGTAPVLTGAAVFGDLQANVAANAQTSRLQGQIVSGNYFALLGVKPSRGRLLQDDDDRAAAERVAVLGFGAWQRLFAGRSDLAGATVRINGHTFSVAGVAPPGFHGTDVFAPAEVWVPLVAAAEVVPGIGAPLSRTSWWLRGIGRLAPGASPGSAAAALRSRAAAIAQSFPDSHEGFTVRIEAVAGAAPGDRDQVTPLAAILLSVTLTVLLIACANVANLLLVRGVARGRETAIRVALGASRYRLVRQQFVESSVLALAGGVLGLLASLWGTELLLRITDAPLQADFTPDVRVVLFALALSAVTALAFGLAPALRGASAAPATALKTEQGSGDARPRSRLQGALVSGQLALSLVLLLAAGLFLKSLVAASGLDVGLSPHGRISMSMNLRMVGYSQQRADAFYRTLLDRVRVTPGVRSASLAAMVPLGGRVSISQLTLPDRAIDPNARAERVGVNFVWPGFFDTLQIPIIRGRALTDPDLRGPAAAAVVSEAMAQRFWPGRDPIGQRFSVDGPKGPFVEIIGVARDVLTDEFTEDRWAFAYLPGRDTLDDVALIAWVDGEAGAALRALEAQVHALDADVAVFNPKTFEQHIADRLDAERGLSRLLGLAGMLALGLAALGLYGVVAFTVARRTREIGVRIALGAQRRDVVALFIRDAARLAVIGLAFGIPPGLAVSVVLSSSLVGVRVADPAAIGGVMVLLTAVTLLAAYIPARRATGLDPIAALRAE